MFREDIRSEVIKKDIQLYESAITVFLRVLGKSLDTEAGIKGVEYSSIQGYSYIGNTKTPCMKYSVCWSLEVSGVKMKAFYHRDYFHLLGTTDKSRWFDIEINSKRLVRENDNYAVGAFINQENIVKVYKEVTEVVKDREIENLIKSKMEEVGEWHEYSYLKEDLDKIKEVFPEMSDSEAIEIAKLHEMQIQNRVLLEIRESLKYLR